MDESFGSDRVGGPNGKFLGAVEGGHVASFEERGLPPYLSAPTLLSVCFYRPYARGVEY